MKIREGGKTKIDGEVLAWRRRFKKKNWSDARAYKLLLKVILTNAQEEREE